MDGDEELVHRARKGDGDALGCLFDRYWTPVLRYLAAQLGDVAQAEDMAAEVFVQVAERLPRLREDPRHAGSFAGFVFTVARHDLYDLRRSQARRRVVPVAQVPDTPDEGADLADVVQQRLDGERLAIAVDLLTPDQREVVLLKYAAGMDNAQAAQVLGKPVTAVKSLQHRALAALRRTLEPQGVRPP